MRAAVIIDDELFRRLKRLAAHQGRTLSEVTQEVLRRGLREAPRQRREAVKLPTFSLGRPLVGIAD
jgi:hypothetical protein